MTESFYDEMDIQLELKDRINYSNILTVSLLSIKRFLLKSDANLDDLENFIVDFFTDIPNAWFDDKFLIAMKNVVEYQEIEILGEFAGVTLDKEFSKEIGVYKKIKKPKINFFKLKNAIINLLHRRNLLIRKEKIEYTDGVNLDIHTLDDLAKYEEEEEEIDEVVESEVKRIIDSEKTENVTD